MLICEIYFTYSIPVAICFLCSTNFLDFLCTWLILQWKKWYPCASMQSCNSSEAFFGWWHLACHFMSILINKFSTAWILLHNRGLANSLYKEDMLATNTKVLLYDRVQCRQTISKAKSKSLTLLSEDMHSLWL